MTDDSKYRMEVGGEKDGVRAAERERERESKGEREGGMDLVVDICLKNTFR